MGEGSWVPFFNRSTIDFEQAMSDPDHALSFGLEDIDYVVRHGPLADQILLRAALLYGHASRREPVRMDKAIDYLDLAQQAGTGRALLESCLQSSIFRGMADDPRIVAILARSHTQLAST